MHTAQKCDFIAKLKKWIVVVESRYQRVIVGTSKKFYKPFVRLYIFTFIVIAIPAHACSLISKFNRNDHSNRILDPDFSTSYDVRYKLTSYTNEVGKNMPIPVCYDREKCGYMDNEARNIIPPIFEYVDYFHQNIAVVKNNGKLGIIDTQGKVIVDFQFDSISKFNEEIAIINTGNKFGYITGNGNIIAKPIFDSAEPFSEGLAVIGVREESSEGYFYEKFGYINRNGKIIIKPIFDIAKSFSEGVAVIGIEVKEKEEASRVGLIRSRKGELGGGRGYKFGYVNSNGDMIIKPKFDSAESFHKGVALIGVNTNEIEDYGCGPCSSMNCSSYIKNYEYINLKGETVSKKPDEEYDNDAVAAPAPLMLSNSSTDIGSDSQKVNPEYQYIGGFYNGLARACKNDENGSYYGPSSMEPKKCKWGYIDYQGSWMKNYDVEKEKFKTIYPTTRSILDISRIFNQNAGTLNKAYQRTLKKDPSMVGSISLQLVIDSSGKVSSCKIDYSDLNNAKLEAKIIALVKKFNFGEANVKTWMGEHTVSFYPN